MVTIQELRDSVASSERQLATEENEKVKELHRSHIANTREKIALRESKERRAVKQEALEARGFSPGQARRKAEGRSARVSTEDILLRRAVRGDEDAAAALASKRRLAGRGTFESRRIPEFERDEPGRTIIKKSPLTGKTVVIREGSALDLEPKFAATFTEKRAKTFFERDFLLTARVREPLPSPISSVSVAASPLLSSGEPKTSGEAATATFTPLPGGGVARDVTQSQEAFLGRVERTRGRQERFGALFDPKQSKGAERVKNVARLLTFGSGKPGIHTERKTKVGRVAEDVAFGFLSWPLVLGGAVPLVVEKSAQITEAAFTIPEADILGESGRALKKVEAGPFSFLPGGTPITEEGAATIISASLFALPMAAAKIQARSLTTTTQQPAGAPIKPSTPLKPARPPRVRVEKAPDPVIQQRLGLPEAEAQPGLSLRPSERFGVVLRVPEVTAPKARVSIVRVAEKPTEGPLLRVEGLKEPASEFGLVEAASASERSTGPLIKIEGLEGFKLKDAIKIEGLEPKSTSRLIEVVTRTEKPSSGPLIKIEGLREPKSEFGLIEVVRTGEKPTGPLIKIEGLEGFKLKDAIKIEGLEPKSEFGFIEVVSTSEKSSGPLISIKRTPEPKSEFGLLEAASQETNPVFFETSFKIPELFKLPQREVVINVKSDFLGELFSNKPVQRGIPELKAQPLEAKPTEALGIKQKPAEKATEAAGGEEGGGLLLLQKQLTTVKAPKATVPQTLPGIRLSEQAAAAQPFTAEAVSPTAAPPRFQIIPPEQSGKSFSQAIVRFKGIVKDAQIPITQPVSRTGAATRAVLIPATAITPVIDEATDVIPAQIQRPIQAQAQAQRPATVPRQITRQEFRPEDITRITPLFPVATTKKKRRAPQTFSVAVRRRGKFSIIDKGLGFEEAVKKGAFRVGTTAAASFKIEAEGAKSGRSPLDLLSRRRFRTAKREPGVIVEKSRFRISTPGEVSEISRKGQATSKRGKKKKKNTFGGNFKWGF